MFTFDVNATQDLTLQLSVTKVKFNRDSMKTEPSGCFDCFGFHLKKVEMDTTLLYQQTWLHVNLHGVLHRFSWEALTG